MNDIKALSKQAHEELHATFPTSVCVKRKEADFMNSLSLEERFEYINNRLTVQRAYMEQWTNIAGIVYQKYFENLADHHGADHVAQFLSGQFDPRAFLHRGVLAKILYPICDRLVGFGYADPSEYFRLQGNTEKVRCLNDLIVAICENQLFIDGNTNGTYRNEGSEKTA